MVGTKLHAHMCTATHGHLACRRATSAGCVSPARYHRFRVTEPGNFTFDTCASIMDVGISIYRALGLEEANLTKSERMIRLDGSYAYNQVCMAGLAAPLLSLAWQQCIRCG